MVTTRSRTNAESTLFAVWNRKMCYSEGAITKQRPLLKSKLATNVFRGRLLVKAYTDKMLENELDGDVIIPSPLAPVKPDVLLQKLFPPKAIPYSMDWMFVALRGRIMKRNPTYTEADWWRNWLKQLCVPESLDYAPDDVEDVEDAEEKASREVKTATFLQAFCKEISTAFPRLKPNAHQWTSYFHTNPVTTSPDVTMPRKPDVSCLKAYIPIENWRKIGTPVSWKHLDTIIEEKKRRKNNTQFLGQIATDLYNKVFLIFYYQEDRRYVVVLTFTGDLFRVSVMDRAGVVHSDAVSYYDYPKLFLQAIVGLTFSPDSYLGYDPNFVSRPLNSLTVTVRGIEYTILQTVWRQNMIQGRATTCWRVMYNGKEYLIKDVWVLEEQDPNEIYYLREAAGIDGVPLVVDWEDVVVNKRVDSTDNNRGVYRPLLNRIHRRIVFGTVGVPIWEFLTRRELVLVYIYLLECHLKLVRDRKILHSDISLYNLMIHKLSRTGLLIDYDYAKDLDKMRRTTKPYPSTPDIWPHNETSTDQEEALPTEEAAEGPTEPALTAEDIALQRQITEEHKARTEAFFEKHGQHTGTQPFMAGEILALPKVVHLPRHDLESFFYVFIYKCCMCLGPKGYMKEEKYAPKFLYTWLHPEVQPTGENIGLIKMGLLTSPREIFKAKVTDHFTPYMSVFADCVENLQQLFKNREQVEITHEAMIAEFNKVLENLPDERPRLPRDIPRPRETARNRQRQRLTQRIMDRHIHSLSTYTSADPNLMTSQQYFTPSGVATPAATSDKRVKKAHDSIEGHSKESVAPTNDTENHNAASKNAENVSTADNDASANVEDRENQTEGFNKNLSVDSSPTQSSDRSAPKANTDETKPPNRPMQASPTFVNIAESDCHSTSEYSSFTDTAITESQTTRTSTFDGLNVTTERKKENTRIEMDSSRNTMSSFEATKEITPSSHFTSTTTRTRKSSMENISIQSSSTVRTTAQPADLKSIRANIPVLASKSKPSERPTKIPQATNAEKARSMSISSHEGNEATRQNVKHRYAKTGTGAGTNSGSGGTDSSRIPSSKIHKGSNTQGPQT